MNPDLYLTLHRQQTIGRCHHLEEAIASAQERSNAEGIDLVIWRDSRVVALVLAGGGLILVPMNRQASPQPKTEPSPTSDPVFDLDAIGRIARKSDHE